MFQAQCKQFIKSAGFSKNIAGNNDYVHLPNACFAGVYKM
jgi:hypothetical protein